MISTKKTNTRMPPLIGGEAFRSYIERMKLLNSSHSRAFKHSAEDVKLATPDWSLPTGLSSFAKTYGEVIKLPCARYWVAGHTLAPYYETTLDPRRRERFLHRLLETAHGPRRPLLAIALTEWFSKLPVLCPECDEEALNSRGFSYVQRHWLLPFLTRCQIHGEVLAEYSEWSPSQRGLPSKIPVLSHRTEAGLLLTNASLAMLGEGGRQFEELGELLRSRGISTRYGRLRRKRLCELVVAYAKNRYEHPELDSLFSSEAMVAKLLAPLGSERSCLHPIVAHVLACALRDEPEVEHVLLPLSARPRNKDLRAAFEASKTATQAAQKAGVSVTTAVIFARAAGYALHERPKILKSPLRAAIVKQLAAGEDIARIATTAGVSLGSVYRVLASSPVIRKRRQSIRRAIAVETRQREWLDLIDANPGVSATQLRRMEPAVYAYLYRLSRKWLSRVTPKTALRQQDCRRTLRVPSGADAALAARLSHAAQSARMGMAERRTRTRLLAAAGRPNDIPVGRSSASLVLEAESESLQSFVFRRLSAAVARLQSEGVVPVPWKVERKAGLRFEVIAKSGVCTELVIADTRAAELRSM